MKRIASGAGLIAAAIFLYNAPSALAADPYHAVPATTTGVVTGSCTETAMSYSISTNTVQKAAMGFWPVTGTTVSFTQASPGCVEVSFSSEAATAPSDELIIEAVLDGSTVCAPNENIFASDSPSDDPSDHAMNYICTSVSAGSHSIEMKYRSRYGGKVALGYRTTIVRYAGGA